ncbi:MAG: hypothetical protein ABEH40_01190 [Haloferacaceae archaeon]
MLDEGGPFEPEEPDPESQWGDPEADLVDVPSAPDPGTAEADVDPELLGLWWRSVALANVALGGVAVGLMVIGFRGMWVPGLAAVALGLLSAGRLYQQYRAFREREDGAGTDADAAEDPDGDRRAAGAGAPDGAGADAPEDREDGARARPTGADEHGERTGGGGADRRNA